MNQIEVRRIIENRLLRHQNLNLFLEIQSSKSDPDPAFRECLKEVQSWPKAEKEGLGRWLSEQSLGIFCRFNQYYRFGAAAQEELVQIYIHSIDLSCDEDAGSFPLEKHYFHLSKWLLKWNPFSGLLYANSPAFPEPVPCFQYPAKKQLAILGIEPKNLKEPILDLGCGESAALVIYLRSLGLDAFGIDRLCPDEPFLRKADWFEFPLEPEFWGSILSHLGFSNHFRHNHLRSDGLFREYALRYIEILQALKNGGTFYYAPGLDFFETFQAKGFIYSSSAIPFGSGLTRTRVTRKVF